MHCGIVGLVKVIESPLLLGFAQNALLVFDKFVLVLESIHCIEI